MLEIADISITKWILTPTSKITATLLTEGCCSNLNSIMCKEAWITTLVVLDGRVHSALDSYIVTWSSLGYGQKFYQWWNHNNSFILHVRSHIEIIIQFLWNWRIIGQKIKFRQVWKRGEKWNCFVYILELKSVHFQSVVFAVLRWVNRILNIVSFMID